MLKPPTQCFRKQFVDERFGPTGNLKIIFVSNARVENFPLVMPMKFIRYLLAFFIGLLTVGFFAEIVWTFIRQFLSIFFGYD